MKLKPLDYRGPATCPRPSSTSPHAVVFWSLFTLLGFLLLGLAAANDPSLKPYQVAAYFICGAWVLAIVLWARKRATSAYQAASAFAILFWVFAAVQLARWGMRYWHSPFWADGLAILFASPVFIALSVMVYIVLRRRLWRGSPDETDGDVS